METAVKKVVLGEKTVLNQLRQDQEIKQSRYTRSWTKYARQAMVSVNNTRMSEKLIMDQTS